ncbi:MAG: glycosyltransferase [Isosphaeraceae bacterium]
MSLASENQFDFNPSEYQPQAELIFVNGPTGSVQAPRAKAIFGAESNINFKTKGRLGSALPAWRAIKKVSGGTVYCIDLGFPQAAISALGRGFNRNIRLIYEIGDPMRPLMQGQGKKGFELEIASWFDKSLPWRADALVFRGTYLRNYFQNLRPSRQLPPSLWLPDGVDVNTFRPMPDSFAVGQLRVKYDLQSRFVIGLVGNIHHAPKHNLFYGWEMVETLARLPESSNITGVIVGDGPGRPVLEKAISKYGLENRIRLVGRVPHDDVPAWMNVFDVAISTQTDDPVGWGRTTAKLPEYLACGTPVLCSDVGEAHRILSDTGQILPYQGIRDETYPEKLANRLLQLSPEWFENSRVFNRELANRLFAYPILRFKLADFMKNLTENRLKPGDWIF